VKYLLSRVPKPYKNKEQFEYLHDAPIGPDWNPILQHEKLVKEKVLTRAGDII